MSKSKVDIRRPRSAGKSSHTVYETAPKAALIMLLSGLFILLISAAIAIRTASPIDLSRPAALISLYAGAAVGGLFCSKRLTEKKQAATSSLIASVILIIILILCKFIIPGGTYKADLTVSVLLHLLIIPVSALASILCGNKPAKRKKHK